MDRQAAYELLTATLKHKQVKGIDLSKDLPALLQHAVSYGFFVHPHSVQTLAEWQRYGDKLWELTLEDDKLAKKYGKLWKVVHNELLMMQAEKKAAERARSAQEKNKDCGIDWGAMNPPMFSSVTLPSAMPSAPPDEKMAEWLDPPAQPRGGTERLNPPAQPRGENPFLNPPPLPPPGPLAPPSDNESDLGGTAARERQQMWNMLAREAIDKEDEDMVEAARDMLAFPVTFTQAAGGLQANITSLDWKLLAQFRSTVGNYGVASEPARQMLDYMFSAFVLLPTNIKGIARLMFSVHQKLLFEAHWQQEAIKSVTTPRCPADPLCSITLDELLSISAYARVKAQALIKPKRCKKAIAITKQSIDKVKAPRGLPIYMGIKQGREEPLESFVDKVIETITRARVQEFMQKESLKQCVLQNGNAHTCSLISTMSGNWSIADLLKKASSLPVEPQAFLASALDKLREGMKAQAKALQEQTKAAQSQVLAALAPLQAVAAS
ncbi:GAK8 protein, partial [Catharus fuscescens]|nr:GAK8 protein [Catharus fuscescens]